MKKLSLYSLFALILLGTLSSFGIKKVIAQEPPKALNVIYFIGDGTALPQVYAGMLATRQELVFPKFPYIGVVDTHSASNDITDSAAGGTALASDHKTRNAMVGMNPDSIPVKTLLEVFAEQGKETGIVVTSYITHATPACFYAKVPHRRQYEEIALQLAEAQNINLAIGGGMKHFNQRKDGINLVERMENELGWKVYDTLADIDVTCKKYAVLANDDHMPWRRLCRLWTMLKTVSSSWWKARKSILPVMATTQLGWSMRLLISAMPSNWPWTTLRNMATRLSSSLPTTKPAA